MAFKRAIWKDFVNWLERLAASREPDFVVGGRESPYLERWFVIPRNRFMNIYLHRFLRSDDDRALHDHPWMNCSVLLKNTYTEHLIESGGIHVKNILKPGTVRLRFSGKLAHRVELHAGECWTLFITGPRYRAWGFHCAEEGWIPWQRFSKPGLPGETGPGCSG